MIRPYMRECILEVGSGIGGNIQALLATSPKIKKLILVEPDQKMHEQLCDQLREFNDPRLSCVCGDLNSMIKKGSVKNGAANIKVDTILYIDVLEHIKEDRTELERASKLLAKCGRIIVLAPAHNSLYSEFDASIGHYRRYSGKTLRRLTPSDTRLEAMFYLDSAGLLLSVANKLMLRQSTPTTTQISTWDKIIIPASRFIDRALNYRIGKTIVAVYIKTEE